MKTFLHRFINETEGQDLIEYALLAATISIGVVLGMQSLRNSVNSQYTFIGASITP